MRFCCKSFSLTRNLGISSIHTLLAASARQIGTLAVLEHKGGALAGNVYGTVSALQALPGPVTVLVAAGDESATAVSAEAAKLQGVQKVLVAQHAAFQHGLAEPLSALLKSLQARHGFTHIVAPASTFGKNFLPRAAALLDVQPVSDVIKILDHDSFIRPIYAGNALATVKYSKPGLRMLTVRTSSFAPSSPCAASSSPAPIEAVDSSDVAAAAAVCDAQGVQWVGEELTKSERPELGTAKVVVCGGRALKSAENFKMLESLADALGGAVGASRAAVDAGYAPNDLQVGQTGKVIAPDLYIGIGISGAIQHLAGIKDAKTIVAINNDPEAPIFQVADYGLVEDLFKAVPELEKEVRAAKQS